MRKSPRRVRSRKAIGWVDAAERALPPRKKGTAGARKIRASLKALASRRRPYSTAGIHRVPCWRCGAPSKHQWQVCADDRIFRGLCWPCDVALNALVLRWMGDPEWRRKVERYKAMHDTHGNSTFRLDRPHRLAK